MDSDSSTVDEPTQSAIPHSPNQSPFSPGDGTDSEESDNEDIDRSPLAPPGVSEDLSPFQDQSSEGKHSPFEHQEVFRNDNSFNIQTPDTHIDESPNRNKSPDYDDHISGRNESPERSLTDTKSLIEGSESPIRNKTSGVRSPIDTRFVNNLSSYDTNVSNNENPTDTHNNPHKSSPDMTQVNLRLACASSKDSDNDGEISDSSNNSRSSSSSSSSNISDDRIISRNDREELHLETSGEAQHSGRVKSQEIMGHGEDLSDVSDLDSNDDQDTLDGMSENEEEKDPVENKPAPPAKKEQLIDEDVELDFEAEEAQEKDDKEDKEEGECIDEKGKVDKSDDEGEIKGEDLEEGEVTDDDENRPEETEPRPICRFYNRGQCTWGASCRFLHPGVTDKGNYTMFDMVRPLVPMNGPTIYSQPIDFRAPYEKPLHTMYPSGRKEDIPVFETSWERGLRQAKELMRKSTKRKETDMDFEEKKMNLSIGQEELDKENDYYTRPASPILNDETWGLKPIESDGKYREAIVPPRYEEFTEAPYYSHSRSRDVSAWGGEYNRRVHYETDVRAIRLDPGYGNRGSKYHASGSLGHQPRQIPDYYDKYEEPLPKKKKHPAREVTMQRVTDKPWREDRYVEEAPSSHRSRGDEWADPWMRSKSPGRKGASRPSRRQSYSSGSSYSTSSSSRSGSSASSYSSYSHNSHSRSRSKSRSRSGSHSPPIPRNVRRKVPERNRTPPGLTQRKPIKATDVRIQEKKVSTDRLMCMNPPAPSPRKQKDVRDIRPPSPGMMRKSAQNPPPPLAASRIASGAGRVGVLERSKAVLASALVAKAAKLQHHIRSSRSTSGSDSSGSSSESSESSYSSSSSSREASPKAVRPQKRIVIDERERLALTQKVKAMDALKLSGQKPQIKLTLKTPNTNAAPASKRSTTGLPELPELNLMRRDRPVALTVAAGKKRPADGDELDDSPAAKVAAMTKPLTKQKATSRREELLKQLKAVEDAIARKRSKV